MSTRAPALPPDERRASIVRAARPLLLAHGGHLTTRQVAEAAGIAEGTLFRVFATKQELMQAVIHDAMDPTAICDDLDRISRSEGLSERLEAAVARMQRGIEEVAAVLAALYQAPTTDGPGVDHPHGPHGRARSQAQAQQLHEAIVRVLEPDAARLACSTDEAAALVRAMAFATSHPHLAHGPATSPARVTQLLLHGLVADTPHPPHKPEDAPC